MQILGLGKNEVRLYPHNQKWNKLFDEEKNKLITVFGKDVEIEHIGSTAVPTICTKPIIGIMIGVKNEINIKQIICDLKKINYIFEKDGSATEPMFFIKTNKNKSLFHLHVTKHNSVQWKNAVGFRNYLRNNPKTAKEYESLKIELAGKFENDRLAYKKGKEKFILSICKKII